MIVILFYQGFRIMCSVIFDIEISLNSFYQLNPLNSSAKSEASGSTRMERLLSSITIDMIILLIFSQALISVLHMKKSKQFMDVGV